MKIKAWALTVVTFSVACTVLLFSAEVAQAVRLAIENCLTRVVPSLMTFMTLSCFVSYTEVSTVVVNVFGNLTDKVFHLPRCCAKVILMSLIGGYPCGARLTADLLKNREITPEIAEHLLLFCIHPSPAYAVCAIGIGVFSDASLGFLIYAVHVVGACSIGFLWRSRDKTNRLNVKASTVTVGQGFVRAVYDSTNAMLAICGFVITVSVIQVLIEKTGMVMTVGSLVGNVPIVRALVYSFLDVVTAVGACAQCTPIAAVVLCAGAMSLGGVSIWLQVAFMLREYRISFGKIIFFRIFHAVWTAGETWIIMKITNFPITVSTGAISVTFSEKRVQIAILFLMCCIFFVVSLDQSIREIKQRWKKK